MYQDDPETKSQLMMGGDTVLTAKMLRVLCSCFCKFLFSGMREKYSARFS